ncbi:SDR family NAD(P)-dependent oxidoreductase [Peptostreptococcus equinus]|uniref:SDR family oxidoreductase n=1 Tax=Peptostreptococcus equinus TaxID=3003601 RepID=A0ABY7JNC6_9FIRM|nr:SDR family oxidoreductase [Peptostreptococcus sp. CBA3647]WAW14600.1 SDR family oxidoreductase [Peptostreptococcus sp. CBA3647]
MKNLFNLEGKIAVIAGASSGLGADAARAFAENGADLALLARREEKLADVATEIEEKYGRKVITIRCDVSVEEDVKSAFEEIIKEFDRVDILFNNAGIALRGGVDDMSESDWEKMMATNVKGIYLACKYALPIMKEQNYGKIINTASVNAKIADKSSIFIRHAYNASKSAVVGLTKGIAASHSQYGITCNAVGPGLFESEMTSGTLFKSEEFLNHYNAINPAGRPGKKGELNGPLLFLASDASSYVTGQIIYVDGGITII